MFCREKVFLTDLSEGSILWNLKIRYELKQQIYVNTYNSYNHFLFLFSHNTFENISIGYLLHKKQ